MIRGPFLVARPSSSPLLKHRPRAAGAWRVVRAQWGRELGRKHQGGSGHRLVVRRWWNAGTTRIHEGLQGSVSYLGGFGEIELADSIFGCVLTVK